VFQHEQALLAAQAAARKPCNVCAACCESYITDGPDCDHCAAAQCAVGRDTFDSDGKLCFAKLEEAAEEEAEVEPPRATEADYTTAPAAAPAAELATPADVPGDAAVTGADDAPETPPKTPRDDAPELRRLLPGSAAGPEPGRAERAGNAGSPGAVGAASAASGGWQGPEDRWCRRLCGQAPFRCPAQRCQCEVGLWRPDCVDSDRQCLQWAIDGECENNPDYMVGACPRSCRLCPRQRRHGHGQPTAAPTTAVHDELVVGANANGEYIDSNGPTKAPTARPTPLPTAQPTAAPTKAVPTPAPSPSPTASPIAAPTKYHDSFFIGNYTDGKHKGCPRRITTDFGADAGGAAAADPIAGFMGVHASQRGLVMGADAAPARAGTGGCDGKTDVPWGPLPALLQRDAQGLHTLVVDFSSAGGEAARQGQWAPSLGASGGPAASGAGAAEHGGILWGDRSEWVKTGVAVDSMRPAAAPVSSASSGRPRSNGSKRSAGHGRPDPCAPTIRSHSLPGAPGKTWEHVYRKRTADGSLHQFEREEAVPESGLAAEDRRAPGGGAAHVPASLQHLSAAATAAWNRTHAYVALPPMTVPAGSRFVDPGASAVLPDGSVVPLSAWPGDVEQVHRGAFRGLPSCAAVRAVAARLGMQRTAVVKARARAAAAVAPAAARAAEAAAEAAKAAVLAAADPAGSIDVVRRTEEQEASAAAATAASGAAMASDAAASTAAALAAEPLPPAAEATDGWYDITTAVTVDAGGFVFQTKRRRTARVVCALMAGEGGGNDVGADGVVFAAGAGGYTALPVRGGAPTAGSAQRDR
jgi:hypothetical protein